MKHLGPKSFKLGDAVVILTPEPEDNPNFYARIVGFTKTGYLVQDEDGELWECEDYELMISKDN